MRTILICGLYVSCGRGVVCGGLFVFRCIARGVVTPPPLEKCFFGFHLTRAVSREPCGFLGVLGPVSPDLQLKKFLTRFMALLPHAPRRGVPRRACESSGLKAGAGRWEARQSKASQSDDSEVVALTRVSSTPSLLGLGVVGKRSKLKLLHADIRNPLSGVPFSVRGKPLTRGQRPALTGGRLCL